MNDWSYNLVSWTAQGKLNPVQISHAEGIYFYDSAGKRYADMSSQLINMNIGHGNRRVIEAVSQQMKEIAYVGPQYAVDKRTEAARRIVQKSPENMAKVFITNSGAEANENAIKIARMFTGRTKIFSGYRSYHGATYGAANLTGEVRRFASEPGIPGFVKFWNPHVYRDILPGESELDLTQRLLQVLRAQIEAEKPDKIAALFLETIVGGNGVLIPPKGYLEGVRELCTEYGILLVCDEVMTGFGRTGKWFAVEHFSVEPDIMTIAKGATCGYIPMGGVVVNRDIANYFDTNKLWCGLTYNAHPVACATACAVLDVYEEENLIENAKEVGDYLLNKLTELKDKHSLIGDVRGIGLLCGIEFVKDRKTKERVPTIQEAPDGILAKLRTTLFDEGFSTNLNNNVLLVAPPFIITEKQIDENIQVLDSVLHRVIG